MIFFSEREFRETQRVLRESREKREQRQEKERREVNRAAGAAALWEMLEKISDVAWAWRRLDRSVWWKPWNSQEKTKVIAAWNEAQDEASVTITTKLKSIEALEGCFKAKKLNRQSWDGKAQQGTVKQTAKLESEKIHRQKKVLLELLKIVEKRRQLVQQVEQLVEQRDQSGEETEGESNWQHGHPPPPSTSTTCLGEVVAPEYARAHSPPVSSVSSST